MENENIINEIEEICICLRKNRNSGMEQLQQFIPKLQKQLPEYMAAGISSGILQESWLEVLTDVMDAMERKDMVLLVDALDYGLKELIEQATEE